MRRILGPAAMLLVLHEPAFGANDPDRPFGFDFTKDVSAYACEPGTNFLYRCDAPQADDRLRKFGNLFQFAVVYHERYGICMVRGLGGFSSTIVPDRAGQMLRRSVDIAADEFKLTYGPHEKFEKLPREAADNPDLWMSALRSGKGAYGYVWSPRSRAALPPVVKAVFVYAKAVNDTRGFVAMDFVGPRGPECLAEIGFLDPLQP